MTGQTLSLDPIELPPEAEAMRGKVRAFLARELAGGGFEPGDLMRHSPEFSRKCGAEGFIGMTWPKEYGGGELSFLERHVVTEELLAAGAPVWAHWVADRQSGPVLIRYGQDEIRRDILPRIVAGECHFCIGMSEPDSGSDLFSVRSKAEKAEGGWRINGRKLWTSNAHRSHYMIALLRTAPATKENRRHGLSQFLVPMDADGLTIRPVHNLTGAHEFNETTFDDVFVPDSHLIGDVDEGSTQVTSELSHERAGPERFLETIFALYTLIRAAGTDPGERAAEGIGRLVAQLHTLRQMSASVAGMIQSGRLRDVEPALVKDLGTNWEQALPDRARDLLPPASADPDIRAEYEAALRHATMIAPKLTIQGGTREILRGIIARGLGLR